MIETGMEFAGIQILNNINCSLEHNSRIGLIGSNGSGKSTLIKLMLGHLTPSSGKVIAAKKLKVAYLAQNLRLNPELTMIDHIHGAREDIFCLKKQIIELSHSLQMSHDKSVEIELHNTLERFQALGGDEHENEEKYVCESLGFSIADYHKKLAVFSGGEQTRICLAAILLMPYDLLILDEPTNHLDIAMIGWLERYLCKLDKPFLVVSHDRTFLDNTVSTIFHLENGSLSVTKGNYSSFSEAFQIARLAQERQYERQQRFIAETTDFIRRNIAGQKTNMAKSRLKQLSRMEIIHKPQQRKQIQLSVNSSGRSGNDVFVLEDVDFGIDSQKVLANKVSVRANYQDRICILGPNGCGKTTLLKILLGEKEIQEGRMKIGASLEVGYYDQHQIALDESITVMDTIWQLVPQAPRGYVLSWLARFGFRGDEVDKVVSVLSGGEKSRLYLCVLIHQNPNLLIMDEPTNHLDIAMGDALLQALKEYSGTIVFVSHDRYFISQLASKYWVFHKMIDNDRVITTVSMPDTGLEDALELTFSKPELPRATPVSRERKKKVNPWHLEQLQNKIDAEHEHIETLQNILIDLNTQLADSATYSEAAKAKTLQARINELLKEIDSSKAQISGWENDYLELSYDE